MDRLKLLRELKGISQQKLADVLHTTQQNIYKYEKGLTSLPIDMLIDMAEYFGVSIDFIVGYTDYPHKVVDPMFGQEDIDWLNKYQKLSDIQKAAVNGVIDSYNK